MAKPLRNREIMENFELLADWLRIKYPGEHFELIVAGGSAMTLEGLKKCMRPRRPTANIRPT